MVVPLWYTANDELLAKAMRLVAVQTQRSGK